ncbi:MAG: thiamine biosynthesis protein ThiI [Zhongshania sp.]|jgi:thiamine biosynthesis protein ThiI
MDKLDIIKIAAQKGKFDFAVLEGVIAAADFINIDQLADEDRAAVDVKTLPIPLPESVILDVRHPDEVDRKSLKFLGGELQAVLFYELLRRFTDLDQVRIYLLCCEKGVMSRLHASHLVEQGFTNLKVYRPS